MTIKIASIALSLLIIAGTTAGALAQTQWERNHPRRDQVNDRLGNQNRRINDEVREGELTRGQARALHQEDRSIRRDERTMARFNNGHITRGEQGLINRQENAVSGQIGR